MGCNAALHLTLQETRPGEVEMASEPGGSGVPGPDAPALRLLCVVGLDRERWEDEEKGAAWGARVRLGERSDWRLGGAGEAEVPHSWRCPGRHKSEITGDIVSVQQVLLKWREIYGWHFVTINQELLINKVSSLFSWNLGGYENCQTDHFIHYFWLMHPDSLTLKEEKKLLHYAKS